MRVVIAGGGTGGHVVPGLAIADALRARDPSAAVLFVGSGHPVERDLVARAGLPYRITLSRSLPRRGAAGRVAALAANAVGTIQAIALLARFRPDVVVVTGGYPSAPAGAAAAVLGRPLVVVEGNAVPGVTARRLARWARAVAVAHPEAAVALGDGTVTVTGAPVRAGLREGDGARFLRAHALAPDRRTVLVLGGSQGARSLNDAASDAALRLRERSDLQIVHQTGQAEGDAVRRAAAALAGAPLRYVAVPFIHAMADAYAAAHLVVSRAGMMTLAEIAVVGLPAIVVPYPHATESHQDHNAAALSRAGAAVVVADREITGERLASELTSLLGDPARLAAMGDRSLALGMPDAAARVLDVLDRAVRR